MATVEKTPTRVRNVAEASRRVLDPLQRLRGYIRLYVSLEAAAIVLLYVFACCWLSLLFDYAPFKVLSVDWVQELHWVFRALVLLTFFYGILLLVAALAINRLMARFRDAALAIELERRFPHILGDRLITAVELANRKKVIEQGYSAAMVDETIMEAAQRVEKLPIKEVFRWGRLWIFGALIVVLSVVMYCFVGAGFAGADYVVNRSGPVAALSDYNEVLSIWFERNVLLQNTIWPRKSYLVFLEPADADLRVGRDRPAPPLRVRAWEYVIADRHARTREGWRLLTWKDLEDKKEILGDPPAAVAPKDWNNLRDPGAGLTVDEVKLFFGKFVVRKGENPIAEEGKTVYLFPDGQKLPFKWATPGKVDEGWPEGWRPLTWRDLSSEKLQINTALPSLPAEWNAPLTPGLGYTIDEVEAANKDAGNDGINNVLAQLERLNDMRRTLDHLDARLADSSMRRKVRKLIVPSRVTVTVEGLSATNTVTLDPMGDNEYSGQFSELKEKNAKDAWTYKYYATGEDYSTAKRTITIVPPPTLQELFREDEQPAYLFYRAGNPSNVKVEDLKGKKQPIQQRSVSLMGGEVVSLDCPAGTDLTLIGKTDKDLKEAKLVQPEGAAEPVPAIQIVNPREFRVTLPNVRSKRDYTLEMLDTDNVSGRRKIKITVKRDDEPSVDVNLTDWVRKTKEGYMVTAKARIPFQGNIKDDSGLLRVNYAYMVSKMESTAVLDFKALLAASNLIGQAIPGTSGPLQGAIFLAGSLDDIEKVKNATGPEGKEVRHFPPDRDGVPQSIPRFEAELTDPVAHPGEFLPRADVLAKLAKAQPAGFRMLFSDMKKVDPDPMTYDLAPDPFVADFNLAEAMKRFASADSKVQPRYRMTLWVEATDTDLDSTRAIDGQDGPKTSASKERYTLIIVPEEELQAEIAKDEADMTTTMSNAIDKLIEARKKLTDEIMKDLAKKKDAGKPEDRLTAENLGPLAIRTAALDEAVGSAQASSKEVLMKYQGLFKELKGNGIEGNKIKDMLELIIEPLDALDRKGFNDTHDKLQALHGDLVSKDKLDDIIPRAQMSAVAADKQLQDLIEKLQAVMDKMQKAIELNALVQKLRDNVQRLQRSRDIIEQIRKYQEERLLNGN